MAHFAKLGDGNIVTEVVVVHNDVATTEQTGIDFLNTTYNTNDIWKQTSYNTRGGVHKLGGTPLRKNYAGIGMTYDAQRDAFIPACEFASWLLNEDTCRWEAPTEYPITQTQGRTDIDGNPVNDTYVWNENELRWVIVPV